MSVELWIEGVIAEFKDGTPFSRAIVRAVGRNEIVMADIVNGSTLRLDRSELDAIHAAGGVKFLADSRYLGDLKFSDLTEKEQLETNRKLKYIQKLQEQKINKITEKRAVKTILAVAQELGEKPPHWQSVRSWYNSFVEAGMKMRGLYPNHRSKGFFGPKLSEKVLEIINEAAKRYHRPSRPTMASIHRNVVEKVIAHNLDNPNDLLIAPTYCAVQSRILDVSYQHKTKSRRGSRALQAELAGAHSGIETSRVLERVEIDHTLLDIHVLHDELKTLLGRPSITVLIDHYSHMVLGCQLSFEKPSFASVCMACMNAFLPKDSMMKNLAIEADWPAHGIPTTLVSDNAMEFWGKNFRAVADEIGSVFQYCPVRKGNYKSRVERFNGIVNSMVLDDLPGVVRKPDKCGEAYDARQEATLTFSEFKRYFFTWLTTVYHNTPLECGMTPNELWLSSEESFPVPVEEEMDLAPILMATDSRELGKGGIRINNLDYNSDLLKDLYRRDGPVTITVKSNYFDLGYILVLDEVNKVYLKIESDEYEYVSGVSLYEHNKIRAAAKSTAKSKMERPDYQRARVKLARERDELHARNSRRKTQVTASKAARSQKVGVNDLKLVVDNSRRVTEVSVDWIDDELSLDGWSVE